MLRHTIRSTTAALAALASLALASMAPAGQPATNNPLDPPPNGPRRADPAHHVLVGATIHVAPGNTISEGMVEFKNGRIVAVASTAWADFKAPEGARVWDVRGMHLYPGFIDAYVEVDVPRIDPETQGAHWNRMVMPQRTALDAGGLPDSTAEELRKLGFTAAAISPMNPSGETPTPPAGAGRGRRGGADTKSGGIFRGSSAVVSLAKPESDRSDGRSPVYRSRAYSTIAFELARGLGGDDTTWSGYPDSQMGAIALIRQTFSDADWQGVQRMSGGYDGPSNALDALAVPQTAMAPPRAGDRSPSRSTFTTPFYVFSIEHELEAQRAAKIAREFNRPLAVLGCGTEFRRLDDIKDDNAPYILPLNFPKAPDVSTRAKAEATDLREMMAWEQGPTNPRRLDAAGIQISLTTSKVRGREQFTENLKKAIKHGLSPDKAFAMVTTNPAELLGVSGDMGSIEVGKLANLIIATGDLFEPLPPTQARGTGSKPVSTSSTTPAADSPSHPTDPTTPAAKPDAKPKPAKILDLWIDGKRHEINPTPDTAFAGTWELAFDPPLGQPARVTLNDDQPPKVSVYSLTDAGKPKTIDARSVQVQGKTVSFVFDHDDFGAKGAASVTCVFQADRAPLASDTMSGSVTLPSGRAMPFTATRRQPSAFDGHWRVIEADGKPVAEDAPDKITLEFKDDSLVLLFHRGEAAPTRIEGENVKLAGDRGTFTHSLKPFNMEGESKDTIRIENGILIGSSVLTSGETHEYKCRLEPAPKRRARRDFDAAQSAEPATPKAAPEAAAPPAETKPPEGKPPVNPEAPPEVKPEIKPEAKPVPQPVSPPVVQTGTPPETKPEGKAEDADAEPEDEMSDKAIAEIPEQLGYPFGPYQRTKLPEQPGWLLIRNVTVWTQNDKNEVLENAAVLVNAGKIHSILSASDADGAASRQGVEVFDAKGMHLTPGLIDCHSHTGISKGVNEAGQAVTSEVRIQDVTDPDSINWYRQLAGGLTAVNNLHGSANPIGGQNAVNKIRWGVPKADDMHFEGAIPGIKFALGENVKQSNWERATTRYPQSRMGVETLIRDRFTAAREYNSQKAAGTTSGGAPFRRDLELEALGEILEGKRLIHCHSYRQDEILMLARVARDFGFKLGTYQHILEGYKVADALVESSIGASCFSDWWAYKVEVQDAIPQAGPIMWEEGVVVSFNSDSDELARRMNTEAAKAVKYSSPDRPISKAEALRFVTINPARQLLIDDRVGSIEPGKDADLALWSGEPLSVYSRCTATWVDGRLYFSVEQDAKDRQWNEAERQRLIQKLLTENKRPGGGAGPGGIRGGRGAPRPTDVEVSDDQRAYYLRLMRQGLDPMSNRAGDCGLCNQLNN